MPKEVCRWGILGAAQIARKNWQAIRHASNCVLTAVASRDPARCRQFVEECQRSVPFNEVPRVCGSYEELLASDDVDAVYLPLPTALRTHWAVAAANAGKHVLVEKPVGTSADDVQQILAACRDNNVQFMDGVMFMHSRRLEKLRAILQDDETVGPMKRIDSAFTFGAPAEFFASNIRAQSDLEPLGCLGDLGWYNIRFTLWAMNWQLPGRVRGQQLAGHRHPASPAPVPTDFSAELYFPQGVSASFYCSFLADIQQWAHVSGTKGSVYLSDFVLPWYGSELAFEVSKPVFQSAVVTSTWNGMSHRFAVREYSNSAATAQESQMFHTFAELARSGQPDPFWGAIALKTQQVLDACLQSARADGMPVELGG